MFEELFDAQVASVAALGEPVRRRLYWFVAGQAQPVSRDQAADALGIARHIVKFHLDRLEADGLLEAEFSRPPGRGGPGAGRPAKLYSRSNRQFTVSLPQRRYDLAGRVMAEAITLAQTEGIPIGEALRKAAHETGRKLSEPGTPVPELLAELGFEPRSQQDCIELANCPFHSLAGDYTELVCGLNLDLIDGLLGAESGLCARLDPGENRCCVKILPASAVEPGPAAGTPGG